MHAHASKGRGSTARAVASTTAANKQAGGHTALLTDNRSEALQLRKLQLMADISPQAAATARLQALANSSPYAVPQRTLQEKLSGGTVQRQEALEEEQNLETRLDQIEQRYRNMIEKARGRGWNIAADNLQRFLDGTGGTKTLEVSWLRGFSAVPAAERANQERFQRSLTKQAYELTDGETRRFSDYWHRQLTGGITTELFYASGTSTIRSLGNFTLKRDGKVITIEGAVEHHWYDPYDWHADLAAYIPGFGSVSDKDALLLQQHRGAKEFQMNADWPQTVQGSIEIVDWWFDSVDYIWRGP